MLRITVAFPHLDAIRKACLLESSKSPAIIRAPVAVGVILTPLLCVFAFGTYPAPAATPVTPLPASAITEFPTPESALSMTIGPEGDIWYVAGPLPPYNRIYRMSRNGIITGEYTISPDSGESELHDITLGPEGSMWFSDAGQEAVGHILPDGARLEFPIPNPRGYREMGSVATGGDGHIWFTDYEMIGRVDTSGNIEEFTPPDPAADIAPSSGNDMWFTPAYGEYIGRITPTGEVAKFMLPDHHPISITPGADGAMWFTAVPRAVGRISATGDITLYDVPALYEENSERGDHGIAVGPEGDVWFTEANGDLGRLTPTGALMNFSGAEANEMPIGPIVFGPEGALWYSGFWSTDISRLTVPLAPSVETPPTIAGDTIEGGVLTMAKGSWAHQPTTFSYQWESCDGAGDGCEDLPGATGTTMVLNAGLVSRTLRVVVTATNVGGATTVTSAASSSVRSRPAGSVKLPALESLSAPTTPHTVGALMTWRFAWSRLYTQVRQLTLLDVPTAANIDVVCHGHGCPFRRKRTFTARGTRSVCHDHKCRMVPPKTELGLARWFHGDRLTPGTWIQVDVLHSSWIGKAFRFSVRANGPPLVRIACLRPGSSELAHVC